MSKDTAIHGVVVVRDPCHGTRKLFITFFKAIELALALIFLLPNGSQNFNFTTEYHGEAIASDGLIDTRKTCPVAPFIEFPAEGIRLEFEYT